MCVCVCVFVRLCVCLRARALAQECQIELCVSVFVCLCVFLCVCLCVSEHACASTLAVSVFVFVCVFVCVCVCVCQSMRARPPCKRFARSLAVKFRALSMIEVCLTPRTVPVPPRTNGSKWGRTCPAQRNLGGEGPLTLTLPPLPPPLPPPPSLTPGDVPDTLCPTPPLSPRSALCLSWIRVGIGITVDREVVRKHTRTHVRAQTRAHTHTHTRTHIHTYTPKLARAHTRDDEEHLLLECECQRSGRASRRRAHGRQTGADAAASWSRSGSVCVQ